MPERHTGQNIAEKLMAVVDKWGISEKISVIFHDQASNRGSSFRQTGIYEVGRA